jgi:alpha-tubulin suppressor-like RCC1 family protein
LLKSGRAWCWGRNNAGQLGNRPDLSIADNYRSFTPVEVLGF